MNREIKFRVWNIQQKRYLAGNGINYEIYPTYAECLEYERGRGVGFISLGSAIKQSDLLKVVVEQFTGFKDKNGKDIYEGDIINFHIYGITHGPESENITNAEVWFDPEDCVWAFGKYNVPDRIFLEGKIIKGYDWYYQITDRVDRNSIEIIGNIHENPELLKP